MIWGSDRLSNAVQQHPLHLRELPGDGYKFFHGKGMQGLAFKESTRAGFAQQVAAIGHFDENHPGTAIRDRPATAAFWQAVGVW